MNIFKLVTSMRTTNSSLINRTLRSSTRPSTSFTLTNLQISRTRSNSSPHKTFYLSPRSISSQRRFTNYRGRSRKREWKGIERPNQGRLQWIKSWGNMLILLITLLHMMIWNLRSWGKRSNRSWTRKWRTVLSNQRLRSIRRIIIKYSQWKETNNPDLKPQLRIAGPSNSTNKQDHPRAESTGLEKKLK